MFIIQDKIFFMKSKIAIVTSGGGMACAYSAGALFALSKEHKIEEPEILVGSSGSAGSLAYFCAGQHESIKNVWIKHMLNKNIINFFRFNKIVDIDYIIDEIARNIEPLDTKKIKDSKTKLFISATNYRTGIVEYFSGKEDKEILFEALKASKAIPIAYNKKIKIGEDYYIDGEIGSPIEKSIEKAIKEGANKIIVINNSTESKVAGLLFKFYSLFVNFNLRNAISRNIEGLLKNEENIENVEIIYITPKQKLRVKLLDKSEERIKEAFFIGYEDMKNNKEMRGFLMR